MIEPHRLTRIAASLVLGALLVAVSPGCAGSRRAEAVVPEPANWKRVEGLIADRKLEAAAAEVERILDDAIEARDADNWTRALIRNVQLRTALHGYETAVRELADRPWPDSPDHRTALHLFRSEALVNYLRFYAWEIDSRERVETDDPLDLRSWTRERILAEAFDGLATLWSERESWGAAPLGELAEYIRQNDYPPRIRGTLRDLVAYHYVESLADTSLWSARESDERFRLRPVALLTGSAASTDPAAHPLVRIAAILNDLERWHLAGRRPEAALEARLQLHERLHAAFDRPEDRLEIRESLERVLNEFGKRFEWWSRGQALLAGFVRDIGEPDSLLRARELALEGERAFPDSLGGRWCRALVSRIDAPDFSLVGMESDAAGRPSFAVTHRNMDALHFRAYRIDPESEFRSHPRNLIPGGRDIDLLLGGSRPEAAWSVELPRPGDHRSHRTFVTPPLDRPGYFVIVASARADFATENNRKQALELSIGDLVLLGQTTDDGYEFTTRSGADGRLRAGVEVSLFVADYRNGHRHVETRPTTADGRVRFALPANGRDTYFALARDGEELAIDTTRLGRYRPSPARPNERTLLYTDRSAYRPGQRILWKAVTYRSEGDGETFRTLADSQVRIDLVDAGGEVVESVESRTNAFGSASGSFRIPEGRGLGRWTLRSTPGGTSSVQVEEYRRPTFEVTILDPPDPPRLNRETALSGEARYYFGLPVANGSVAWRVTRETIYPRWWFLPRPEGRARTIAGGIASLGENGRFTIRFTAETDERDADREGLSYRYRLSADVTDDGGETRSASRAFRLGFVAIESSIEAARGFFTETSAPTFEVLRVDLDGAPRPGAGSWRLVELRQPAAAALPADQPPEPPRIGEDRWATAGDRQRPRWDHGYAPGNVLRAWKNGDEVARGTVAHDHEGRATIVTGELPEGAYRLIYTTTDTYGAAHENREEFVVASREVARLALPAVLIAERDSVQVGETLRVFVHSALPQPTLSLEIAHAGEVVARHELDAGSPRWIEFRVREEHRGGLSLRLISIRDHQLMRLEERVHVPWDDRELRLEFSSFRDRLRPGDRETWSIRVLGNDGEALHRGTAELLAYMYDRSLDLFAAHVPPDPTRLLPVRSQPAPLHVTLGQARVSWTRDSGFADTLPFPSLRGDRLAFVDGSGIGGLGIGGLGGGGRVPPSGPILAGVRGRSAEAARMDVQSFSSTTEADRESGEPGQPTAKAAAAPTEVGEPEVRSDFSETAFWEPHLVVGDDGTVSFEFTVPDSVTEWSVWVHALTKDLRAGSIRRETRSSRELLVRPYLPRFLREGDTATVRVLLDNSGDERLTGRLDLEIFEPHGGDSLLAEFGLRPEEVAGVPFSVDPGESTPIEFALAAPDRVGDVAVRVVARAGEISDGELRPLPLLPSRIRLTQSRFAALHDVDRRELRFADLADDDDPTRQHEQLVVTVDAQLFYGVLRALPYLVNYPYECTEQTLNRFLSTGIVTSLFDDYPAVAEMARRFGERETVYEAWEESDPNRTISLEETPWRIVAGGGDAGERELARILDPTIATRERETALARLKRSQSPGGGFPWWPGGPDSPHMTLYVVSGLSRALEFGIDVPRDVVARAWRYLEEYHRGPLSRSLEADDGGIELLTFLGYVLSAYPDDTWTGGAFRAEDRKRMLERSFRDWRKLSPMLKAQLALTLHRAGRTDDATLVFDSIMDSSRTTRDGGTFWAPEERAWLWYRDTVESHAFALRALTELRPDDPRRQGLVQWLFLDKKLNHWKSTRATAEAIYALAHHLADEGSLGVREAVRVQIGDRERELVFEPDEFTVGRNRVIVAGPSIDAASMATIVVEKRTPGLAFASATWHYATERLPAESRGDLLSIERRYFLRYHDGKEWTLRPLEPGSAVAPGDQVEVQLSIRARLEAEYVQLRDPRGAGFEPVTVTSGFRWDFGPGRYEEVRDSATNFFFERLPAGEYTLRHRLRANVAGTFRVGPATLQSMYAPEFTAFSSGAELHIESSP